MLFALGTGREIRTGSSWVGNRAQDSVLQYREAFSIIRGGGGGRVIHESLEICLEVGALK